MDLKYVRSCRKCGNPIPVSIRVDGKIKSLQNRKFCLDCSPYGHHNTSSTHPIPKGEQRKRGEKEKEIVRLSLYKRALQRKVQLIEMSGGGCSLCGYKKNRQALSFHHLDRSTKKFGLSLNNLWSKSWEEIVEEWKKCDLVCLNCHAEIENALRGKNIVARVNERYGTSF